MDPILSMVRRVREAHGTQADLVRQIAEAGGSLDDFIGRIRRAYYDAFNKDLPYERQGWVVDVFPDHVIVSQKDKFFLVNFAVDGDAITFDDPLTWPRVTLKYVPAEPATPAEPDGTFASTDGTDAPPADAVQEALRLDLRLPLQEATKKADGVYDAVIVVEGKSANANWYTQAALKSGVDVFEGVPLVADHESEAHPEGSIHNVIGRVSKPYLGQTKEGLNALRGEVFISAAEPTIRTKVEEGLLGGLSLRAWGAGKRDKTQGFVVESFQKHPYTNVAMVTVPAAGGGIETLQESDRTALQKAILQGVTPEDLARERPDLVSALREGESSEELKLLKEAHVAEAHSLEEALAQNSHLLEENARLFKDLRTGQAGRLLDGVLAEAKLPEAAAAQVRDRAKSLVETFATHGSTQTEEQLKAALQGLAEAEKAYLAKLLPHGVVSGVTVPGDGQPVDPAAAQKKLEEAFTGLVPVEGLKVAVTGR